MSAPVHPRAERLRIARLLRTDPETLTALDAADPAELHAYREAITESLFAPDRGLRQCAEAARLLPVGVLATIAERAFGPVLCARIAGLISEERATGVAKGLGTAFLAEVAAEVDPRRIAGIVGGFPADRAVAIALVCVADGEHVAMGRFVAHMSPEATAACVAALDPADLLRIAFTVEAVERLPAIFDLLDDEALLDLERIAAEHGLAEELAFLEAQLPETATARIARLRA